MNDQQKFGKQVDPEFFKTLKNLEDKFSHLAEDIEKKEQKINFEKQLIRKRLLNTDSILR